MIKFNHETGILECVASIKEVEKFIKEYMGKINRIHCGSRSRNSRAPKDDAKRRNANNARLAGIKNTEQWDEAVRLRKLEYWHYYTEENDKIIPDPFTKE